MRIALPPTATLFLLLPFCSMAQTGPAGVGSSSSNVLWLSADRGTTSLLGLLSSWADRSGNNNDAATPLLMLTSNPTVVPNAINGLPVLRFDGNDDMLEVPDAASLDLTKWHFFIVVKPNLQKDYNAWITKGVDGQENFEMLSYATGNMHTPVYWTNGTRATPSAPDGQVVTSAYRICEYSYDKNVGRVIYTNGSSVYSDSDNKTPQVNNHSVYIGNERGISGRNLNGDIAEIIVYNGVLNTAQRIIVNNYLSSKYGLNLTSGDLYVQDSPANGNYDQDVGGIGRGGNTSNQQLDSWGGIVRITSSNGISNNNRYLFWGHDGGALNTTGNTDHPSNMHARWNRVWRVSEVNSSGSAANVGDVDITFDLSNSGSVTASQLRLIVDTDGDGLFADESPIGGATALGGGKYRFSDVDRLTNGRRFTLGTTSTNTPLPIELLSFSVAPEGASAARVDWSTASELDNDHFTIERSIDAASWSTVAYIEGAGTSSSVIQYAWTDEHPIDGTSYYRLKQTDIDGTSTTSDIVSLERTPATALLVVPNPASDRFRVTVGAHEQGSMRLLDATGHILSVPSTTSGDAVDMDVSHLVPGLYLLQIGSGDRPRSVRVVVQ